MNKFDAFQAMKDVLRANANDPNIETLLSQIKQGKKQIRPVVIGFRKELTSDTLSLVEPDDKLVRGVSGLKDGQLGSSQALLVTGIQLRAAYSATDVFGTDAGIKGGFFTHLEDATSNKGLQNGFFDFTIGNTDHFKEASMAMFGNKNTNERAGFYGMDTPNIFGLPNESLEFSVKGVVAPTDYIALSIDIYGVHTI